MGEQVVARTETRESEAEKVIRSHMGYAMAAAVVPIPLVDLAAVTAIHLDLLKKLAKIYDVELDSRSSKSFITSVTAALGGNLIARVGASAVKSVPVVGSIAGGITQVVVTGASAYAVGMTFRRIFRDGRALSSADREQLRADARRYFAAGRERARRLASELGFGTRETTEPGDDDD